MYGQREIHIRRFFNGAEHAGSSSGSRRTGVGTHKILAVTSPFDENVDAYAEIGLLLIFHMIGSSLLEVGVGSASRGVTQDIQEGNSRRSGIAFQDIRSFLYGTEDVCPQRRSGHIFAFALYREIQGMQGVIARLNIGYLIEGHVHQGRAVRVQRNGLDIGRLTHAVADLEFSSFEIHHIRHTRVVIVIIVVLMGRDVELVMSGGEDRCAEEVVPLSGRVLRYQIHAYLLAVQRLRRPAL